MNSVAPQGRGVAIEKSIESQGENPAEPGHVTPELDYVGAIPDHSCLREGKGNIEKVLL